jgi:hypothetical protein
MFENEVYSIETTWKQHINLGKLLLVLGCDRTLLLVRTPEAM